MRIWAPVKPWITASSGLSASLNLEKRLGVTTQETDVNFRKVQLPNSSTDRNLEAKKYIWGHPKPEHAIVSRGIWVHFQNYLYNIGP